ncbi:MAG: response regulator [Deltaproteobacteria bacterium]|jgi:DNA-binding response OmpR family regulator|nr:response regulator [Deltaproteobacteria bacterium]
MSVKVLLMIGDAGLKAALAAPLADRFTLIDDPLPEPSAGQESLAQFIIEAAPDIVLMDYLAEDALSVKVLQEVLDSDGKAGFIFVDSKGSADRENIMMAFNEGAQAFIPADIQPVVLVNYLNRIVSGPRRRLVPDKNTELELQKVNDRLSSVRTKLNNAQKLIAYLLSTPLGSQPRKAIILSDSGYQRELLKKHLEDNNFIVLTASTIAEATAATLSEKPRIIISDYELDEGQTGVDFCKELKFNRKYMPCYFVVCTANQDKVPQIMTPGNGVDDCVLKPASLTSLNEFLARVSLGLII